MLCYRRNTNSRRILITFRYGCYGPSAGLYNVFAISYQGTEAELENLIYNVYPTIELLESAILLGDVCACMPSPDNDEQGLYSLFIIGCCDCDADAGTVINPFGSTTICSEMGSITVNVSGNNTDASNYIQVFLLTDLNYTIIEVSTNGVFSTPSDEGGYVIHSLNVNADESEILNQNLIGLNMADLFLQLVCFDVSPGAFYDYQDVITVTQDGGLTIYDEYNCDFNTGLITITLSIYGGIGVYTLAGDINNNFVAGQNIVITLDFGDLDLEFDVYDENGCSISFSLTYPECCYFEDNPDCDYYTIGCMSMSACNYNPFATVSNGDCDYGITTCPEPCNAILGCTDEMASNYNPDANCDDDSCVY